MPNPSSFLCSFSILLVNKISPNSSQHIDTLPCGAKWLPNFLDPQGGTQQNQEKQSFVK